MAFVWKRAHSAVAAGVALVLVGGGVALALGGGDSPAAAPTPSSVGGSPSSTTTGAAPTPTPTAQPKAPGKPTDPLTGAKKVSPNKVIAVKVENIGLARPQVGLSKADIVFAEEVEGAQTRLVAIYHSTFPKAVEPVRSARSTDVQLLPLFGHPGLVYSGANSRVQRKINGAPIAAMYNETRDPRRVAPHNVRVNLAALAQHSKAHRPRDIGWRFAAKDARLAKAKKARTVSSQVGHDTFRFPYAKGRYTVVWNGQKYADGDSGTVTKADNVIVLHVHNHPDGNRDVLGSASVMSDTKGSGKVTIYRGGRKLTGTWERPNRSSRMRLRDHAGHDLTLAPGQTWVTLQG